jgi:hypothetical protein
MSAKLNFASANSIMPAAAATLAAVIAIAVLWGSVSVLQSVRALMQCLSAAELPCAPRACV